MDTVRAISAPAPAVSIAGRWTMVPLGVILHGSRSGAPLTVAQEFEGTVSYAKAGAPVHNPDGSVDYLGWNATIGEGIVAEHIDCEHWGWNAREHSHEYLAIEFAQAREGDPISDAQVDAFCWWFLNRARAVWPDLPLNFPTHAELPAGKRDGKTDVFPDGTAIRDRIRARLE